MSHICRTKCEGVENAHGNCCSVQAGNWILGSIADSDKFLENLSHKFGYTIEFSDVFYTYEEGKAVFPQGEDWQEAECYPALRFSRDYTCIFYSPEMRSCMVYDIRPETCKKYVCNYLKNNASYELIYKQ